MWSVWYLYFQTRSAADPEVQKINIESFRLTLRLYVTLKKGLCASAVTKHIAVIMLLEGSPVWSSVQFSVLVLLLIHIKAYICFCESV